MLLSIELARPVPAKEDGRCDVHCSRSPALPPCSSLAAPALACGGLIGPNGAVNLLRTTTLAGYHDGVEHYVTSFEFAGGGGAFGSIIPLPGIPTDVVRGGDWTLQRLIRETDPPSPSSPSSAPPARRDARSRGPLETTHRRARHHHPASGGGAEVGVWAKEHGFRSRPTRPRCSTSTPTARPIFLAAGFDADAAAERGQAIGDGTPGPPDHPHRQPVGPAAHPGAWARTPARRVEADVYLLTDDQPAHAARPGRPPGQGWPDLDHSAAASDLLLADLRSDKGMEWVPDGAWLTKIAIDAAAERPALRPGHRRLGRRAAVAARRRLRAVRSAAGAAPATPLWVMLLALAAIGRWAAPGC